MNVLSLFDGMSCGQIALERANIKVDKYFASEIDKHAIKVAKHNYANTIHLGDVQNIQAKDLPQIDLLIGGSPCQGFSFNGKQLNFNDPRSKLFFEYARLLKELNPKYFLLENVNMKQEYQDTISSYLGVSPININSRLVSAQNRVRLYWTNIPQNGLPVDKNIQFKDVSIDGSNKIGSSRGRCIVNGKRQDHLHKVAGMTKQRIEQRIDHRTNCLTTVSKDNVVILPDNVAHTEKTYYNDVSNVTYRYLTPLECERLQTVPDNYTACVSKTQRLKMLGNGWTVDIIAHLFKGMIDNTPE